MKQPRLIGVLAHFSCLASLVIRVGSFGPCQSQPRLYRQRMYWATCAAPAKDPALATPVLEKVKRGRKSVVSTKEPEDIAADGLGKSWKILLGAAATLGASVRPAQAHDMEDLVKLHTSFRREMNPKAVESAKESLGIDWMRNEITEVLATNDFRPPHVLVLCHGDAIDGYIYSTVEDWFGRPSLYIAELFVARGERGRGYGSILTAASLHQSCEHGITSSHLCVGARQRKAQRIYRHAFGFAPLVGAGEGGSMKDLELVDAVSGVARYLKAIFTTNAREQLSAGKGTELFTGQVHEVVDGEDGQVVKGSVLTGKWTRPKEVSAKSGRKAVKAEKASV